MKTIAPSLNVYLLIVALWAVYTALTFTAPPAPGSVRFELDSVQLQAIRLTIVIPVLITWLLGMYGALHFKQYANSIKDSPDGRAMGNIANGIGWFVAYLISLTFLGAIITHFYTTDNIEWFVSLRNILAVTTAFFGFLYIFVGAHQLSRLIHIEGVWNFKNIFLLFIPYCFFAMAFTYAFFMNPDLIATGNSIPTYVLPPPVLLAVIVIPYLFMWFLGILAVLNLRVYARNVPGIIYRKVLSRLVRGMVSVIIFTISIQILNVLAGTISKWSLGRVLLLVYLLILLIAVGYGSIASGARRLAKIEANS